MQNSKVIEMPLFYMMIGVPGSGKSTWIKNFLESKNYFDEWVILSTDNWIEEYAAKNGLTYNDAFRIKGVYSQASSDLNEKLKEAIKNDKHIIWDQTNTTKKSRISKLASIPAKYIKNAVFLRSPDSQELSRRLKLRPGKEIPISVLRQMEENLEEPTYDEGWNVIIKN